MNHLQNAVLIALDQVEGANMNGDIHPGMRPLIRAAEMVMVERGDVSGMLIPKSDVMAGDVVVDTF